LDFLLAFNVTIYGMGIVFMALLVLMVATMLLTKVFSMATGQELSVAPGGTVGESTGREATAAAQLVTAAAVGPSPFTLSVAGTQHKVEIQPGSGGASTVRLDGTSYQVQRDPADQQKILVNGQAHTVEVKELAGSAASVLIDGMLQKVEIGREAPAPVVAPAPAAPSPATPMPAGAGAGERVTAPLPGKILSVMVKVGDRVQRGDELCVIEAMKMGNSIKAMRDGIVREVLVSPGASVAFGALLLVID
jgi:glutaconyl-CoA decarboxylase